MAKLAKILVPTAFAPADTRALKHAAAIAARTGAELHVLHVQIFNRDLYGWAAIPNVDDVAKIIGDLCRRDLDQAVEGLAQPVVREVIKDVKEAPAILRYAQVRSIDLIIMGTHARKGVSRMFIGSVAAEVLRQSPVSVMAVGPEHVLPPDSYRHVLAPVDFSDSSSAALQQAAAIAKQHHAELTVMHVVESRVPSPYDRLVESSEEMHAGAVKALDDLLEKLDLAQAPQHKLVVVGRPDELIVSHAREHTCDLIVQGTVGLTGLSRLLLGSVTERVVRDAPCAVLAHRGEILDNL